MFALILCLIGTAYSQKIVNPVKDGPTNGVTESLNAKKLAEPGQKTAENKTWENILNTYIMLRQGATAVLREVNVVLDVVESVQNQIDAIANVLETFESIAEQCTTVVYNVREFSKSLDSGKYNKRPWDAIIYLEEEILQRNDSIMVGVWQDLPESIANVQDRWGDLKGSTIRIKDVALYEWDSLKTTARGITWFSWAQKEARDSVARHMNGLYKDMLKRIMQTDNKGHLTAKPEVLASENVRIRRAELVSNYSIHELQGERITYLSSMLLRETKNLETVNMHRRLVYNSRLDNGDEK